MDFEKQILFVGGNIFNDHRAGFLLPGHEVTEGVDFDMVETMGVRMFIGKANKCIWIEGGGSARADSSKSSSGLNEACDGFLSAADCVGLDGNEATAAG